MSKYRVIEIVHGDEYQVWRGESEYLCECLCRSDAERIARALRLLDKIDQAPRIECTCGGWYACVGCGKETS